MPGVSILALNTNQIHRHGKLNYSNLTRSNSNRLNCAKYKNIKQQQ